MFRSSKLQLVFLLLAVGTVGGSFSSNRAEAGQVKKSLFFGIDGLGFGVRGFSATSTPNMDSLINGSWQAGYNGAYSDQAFAGGVLGTSMQQTTVSGPGWSTMLTGVWTDRHGVTGNGTSFTNGDYVNNPAYLATIKEAIPTLSTASYVYWPPIENNIIGSIGNDGDPTNDVNFHAAYSNDVNAVNAAVAGISDVGGLDPDAVFISVDLVDGAGHACGSSGACYATAVQTADSFVGQALAAIINRPDFANEDWQIVVTADHGHRAGGGHGGQSDLERTIPFIVASKGVNQGNYATEFVQGVSHADASPTILDHFGVNIPSHYYGVSRASGPRIGIFGDLNDDGNLDLLDWSMYIVGLGVDLSGLSVEEAYQQGDLTGDLVNDHVDFLAFKGAFDAANGVGSFEIALASIPEPSSILLGILCLVCFSSKRLR